MMNNVFNNNYSWYPSSCRSRFLLLHSCSFFFRLPKNAAVPSLSLSKILPLIFFLSLCLSSFLAFFVAQVLPSLSLSLHELVIEIFCNKQIRSQQIEKDTYKYIHIYIYTHIHTWRFITTTSLKTFRFTTSPTNNNGNSSNNKASRKQQLRVGSTQHSSVRNNPRHNHTSRTRTFSTSVRPPTTTTTTTRLQILTLLKLPTNGSRAPHHRSYTVTTVT